MSADLRIAEFKVWAAAAEQASSQAQDDIAAARDQIDQVLSGKARA